MYHSVKLLSRRSARRTGPSQHSTRSPAHSGAHLHRFHRNPPDRHAFHTPLPPSLRLQAASLSAPRTPHLSQSRRIARSAPSSRPRQARSPLRRPFSLLHCVGLHRFGRLSQRRCLFHSASSVAHNLHRSLLMEPDKRSSLDFLCRLRRIALPSSPNSIRSAALCHGHGHRGQIASGAAGRSIESAACGRSSRRFIGRAVLHRGGNRGETTRSEARNRGSERERLLDGRERSAEFVFAIHRVAGAHRVLRSFRGFPRICRGLVQKVTDGGVSIASLIRYLVSIPPLFALQSFLQVDPSLLIATVSQSIRSFFSLDAFHSL